MPGLIKKLFERAMTRQQGFVEKLPDLMQQKLEDAGTKYAEVIVTGPEGGIIYFTLKDKRLKMIDSCPDAPDGQLDRFFICGDIINYEGGDDVIVDICNLSLSPREAVGRGFLKVNTDRVIYDTEEFIQAFEMFLSQVQDYLRPLLRDKKDKDKVTHRYL